MALSEMLGCKEKVVGISNASHDFSSNELLLGETVSAFESWCPSRSGSRSASIQDIFGLAYGGRSLVMSFASKLPVARALSTKPFLLKPTTPNYGFFWSGKVTTSLFFKRLNILIGGHLQ